MPDFAAPQEPKDTDEGMKRKVELATTTYEQVLDTTKHQDDKIARLITSIAFLTAAALALANLGQAQHMHVRFDVGPDLPLSLIAIVTFTILVIASVALLIFASAPPLHVRKQGAPGEQVAGHDAKDLDSHQIADLYFINIAGYNKDGWYEGWQKITAETLEQHRFRALVNDARQISRRSRYKYYLRTFASALFSLSLLALVLAVLFVSFAAGLDTSAADTPNMPPPPAHPLAPHERLFIAVTLYLYCLIQLAAYFRMPESDEGTERTGWMKAGEKLILMATPAAVAVYVLYPQPWFNVPCIWVGVMAVLAGASILGAYLLSEKPTNLLIISVFALAALISTAVFGSRGIYIGQLVVAVLSIMLVAVFTLVLPVIDARRR